MDDATAADAAPQPSGTGCFECEATGGWWMRLRRCTTCGQIGCCDSSPSQHASRHAAEAGHPVARSFEPGEDWYWDYRDGRLVTGPPLPPPLAHPVEQPVPGPAGRVPDDWEQRLR